MPSILIIEPHGVYRRGLQAVIRRRLPQSLVCDVATPDDIAVSASAFDLVLIDTISLSGLTKVSFRSKYGIASKARCAVTSYKTSRDQALTFLASGFDGMLFKLQPEHELTAAVEDILAGRIYLPSCLAGAPSTTHNDGPPQRRHNLTPRQRDVLLLLADGLSNKEIARKLGVAPATIRIHVSGLLKVLGVRNRAQAASAAANLEMCWATNWSDDC